MIRDDPPGAFEPIEADRCAVPERAVKDVAQVQKSGQRGGAAGTRGGLEALNGWRQLDGWAMRGRDCRLERL